MSFFIHSKVLKKPKAMFSGTKKTSRPDKHMRIITCGVDKTYG